MAVLKWDQDGQRQFEAGVERGVLYPPDGPGVAWNGILGVDEGNNNEIESYYFDGIKSHDLVTAGEYGAVLRAYTYPDEFLPFDGIQEEQRGVYLADQIPGRFHLCYRTRVGNDQEGADAGYKLHLLYNLTANATQRNWETLGLEVTPTEFEWDISGIPEEVDGHRPTAHMIIDSREVDPWLLEDIEDILYGTETEPPTMPSLKAMVTFIRKWDRMIIIDNGDGTWTAITQDDNAISIVDGVATITADDSQVTIIDPDTYTISSSNKNDEDVVFP